jgi:hypothetical protein
MVSQKHVAGFAVDTDEVAVSIGITAFQYHEPEVNG